MFLEQYEHYRDVLKSTRKELMKMCSTRGVKEVLSEWESIWHKSTKCSFIETDSELQVGKVIALNSEHDVCKHCLPLQYALWDDPYHPLTELLDYLKTNSKYAKKVEVESVEAFLQKETGRTVYSALTQMYMFLGGKLSAGLHNTPEFPGLRDLVNACLKECEAMLGVYPVFAWPWKTDTKQVYAVVDLLAAYTSSFDIGDYEQKDTEEATDTDIFSYIVSVPHVVHAGYLVYRVPETHASLATVYGHNVVVLDSLPSESVIETARAFILDGIEPQDAFTSALALT